MADGSFPVDTLDRRALKKIVQLRKDLRAIFSMIDESERGQIMPRHVNVAACARVAEFLSRKDDLQAKWFPLRPSEQFEVGSVIGQIFLARTRRDFNRRFTALWSPKWQLAR